MSAMEWTKEQVYDEQIYPLIALCREHEIPIVCTFQPCRMAQREFMRRYPKRDRGRLRER